MRRLSFIGEILHQFWKGMKDEGHRRRDEGGGRKDEERFGQSRVIPSEARNLCECQSRCFAAAHDRFQRAIGQSAIDVDFDRSDHEVDVDMADIAAAHGEVFFRWRAALAHVNCKPMRLAAFSSNSVLSKRTPAKESPQSGKRLWGLAWLTAKLLVRFCRYGSTPGNNVFFSCRL